MSKLNIFQIYYSEDTRDSIEEGFIPLSNMSNERPDWFEYWPIRNYIINNQLNKKYFYGFLSPKFSKKPTLSSYWSIRQFLPVVLFCPLLRLRHHHPQPLSIPQP
jgi:hypothetical protein